MSCLTGFPAAILDTVLGHLALLFLAGAAGDLVAARHAASQMLAAYQPETPDELRLAAEIISFSFHALEALSQAAGPAISLTQQLRLRGSAVSLSRESHKSQRKLDQLRKARRTGSPDKPLAVCAQMNPKQACAAGTSAKPLVGQAAAKACLAQPAQAMPPLPEPAHPKIDKAMALIESTRQALASAGKNGGLTWTQGYQQRQTAKRIVANLKKNQSKPLPPSAAAGLA